MMAPRMSPYIMLALAYAQVAAAAFKASCTGGTVYINAHADDDLLFQSPALVKDVLSGACITSVVFTAGDSGSGTDYSRSRESGNEAAYANILNVPDQYTESLQTLAGQPVMVRTLTAAPQIQKVWFRLPDGGMDGNGYGVTNYESIRDLFFGVIGTIQDMDGTASFTLETLKQAVGEVLTARKPSRIRTLDHLSNFDAGDHSDHITTGRLAKQIADAYAPSASFEGYMGYPVSNLPPTMSTTSDDFKLKESAFFDYTPYDSMECQSFSLCQQAGRAETSWLMREYTVNSERAVSSTIGTAQTQAVMPSGGSNVADLSRVSASASTASNPPFAAIDGNIGGWPGNSTAEWQAPNAQTPVTFTMDWGTAIYNITSVVLYDRPNLNDWITGGTLTFSDNSVTFFEALYNDGSATVINLKAGGVLTSSIVLTITDVAASTSQLGLSEFAAYGVRASGNATISPTVVPDPAIAGDRALEATATASSDTPGTGQTASKAIDGVISGYKEDGSGDYHKEWASGASSGVSLTLDWPYIVTVSQVVLYDRPNFEDQITGGTLTFSDGTSVSVPSLANGGSATTVDLVTPVNTTSLRFSVTSVSSSTGSAGLAEIQVFSIGGGTSSTGNSTSTAPVATPSGRNLALSATAVASSELDGQTAAAAIEGWVDGYKEDGSGIPSEEWASGTGVGTTLTLTWSSAVTFSTIVLYDRPNRADQMTGGTFTFSSGSPVSFGALVNDGSATVISLPSPVTTTSLLLTVTSVSSTTTSVGLGDIQIFAEAVAGGTPTATSNTTSSSVPTAAPSAAPSGGNWALAATARASSESTSTSQTADKAIDGVISGYESDGSGDYTKEWAAGVGAGATLTLTWPYSITISQVVLHDRPNLSDHIMGGTLTFSDGTSVSVGALVNDGSSTLVNLATPVTTSSLEFAVTSVSGSTGSAGLAEIQVFNSASVSGSNGAVTATSGSANSTIASGTATSTSAAPSATSTSLNLALSATAVASSQADSTAQTASKAIDGYVDGYKENGSGIYWEEWASGSGVGTTLELTWPSPVTFSTVVLHDRPNLSDQMTGGTLTFGTGETVAFGPLVNDGSATVVTLAAPVTTTTLLLTVTSVSPSTGSVGLAEIEVFASALGSSTVTPSTNLTSSSLPESNSTSATSSALPSGSTAVNSTLSALPSSTANSTGSALSTSTGLNSSSTLPSATATSLNSTSVLPSATALNSTSATASATSLNSTSALPSATSVNSTSALPSPTSMNSSSALPSATGVNSASSALLSASSVVSSTLSSSANSSAASSSTVSSSAVPSSAISASASASPAVASTISSAASSVDSASISRASVSSVASASAQSVASISSASAAQASQSSVAQASQSAAAASSAASASAASVSSASVASASSAARPSSTSVSSASRPTVSSTATMVTSTRAVASSTSTGIATAPTTAPNVNIARLGKATATAFRPASPPSGVIDNIVGGVSLLGFGNPAEEWAADPSAGASVQLDFPSKYLMKTIYLFGAVNTGNSITSGTLHFSDGSTVAVKSVSPNGTAINLGTGKTSSSVRFTITSAKTAFINPSLGLAEIKIFNAAPVTCSLLNPGCLKAL